MKNRTIISSLAYLFLSGLIAAGGLLVPARAFAAADSHIAPIVISEMSPGTTVSASQEFIELYNQSTEAIDLTAGKWQVQIASSKATTWDKAKTITLTGMFYPGTYLLITSNYVASGEAKSYLQDYATAQFSAGMTTSSGHIRVVRSLTTTTDQISDRLEWSTQEASGGLVSEGIDSASVFTLASALEAGQSIKHALDEDHIFLFSSTVSQNFLTSTCPTPTANNIAPESPGRIRSAPLATDIDTDNPSCATDETGSDDPEHDSDGSTSEHESPDVLIPDETANDSVPTAHVGLQPPQVSELLPNPGLPLTDESDEFIELYNPNDVAYDLSGLVLDIGSTGSKHYTFPAGTMLGARAFKAFFSRETHISLSNSGGRVALRGKTGQLLSQSEVYGVAKDDQAWALRNGGWQWTSRPSPNAVNVFVAPAAKVTTAKTATVKATKTSAKKKTTKAKTAKTAKAPVAKDFANANAIEQRSPLHPLALAVVGGFAILYGGYEYRHDVANKFHKLRTYRAARRKNR